MHFHACCSRHLEDTEADRYRSEAQGWHSLCSLLRWQQPDTQNAHSTWPTYTYPLFTSQVKAFGLTFRPQTHILYYAELSSAFCPFTIFHISHVAPLKRGAHPWIRESSPPPPSLHRSRAHSSSQVLVSLPSLCKQRVNSSADNAALWLAVSRSKACLAWEHPTCLEVSSLYWGVHSSFEIKLKTWSLHDLLYISVFSVW